MGTIKTKIENRMANKYGLKVAVEIEENGEAIYIARVYDNGGEEIIADIGMDGSYAYFVEGFERLTTSQKTGLLTVIGRCFQKWLPDKKYKYQLPKFLCKGIQCYLARDLIYDHYVISYGILSDDYQSHFTDAEMEELIKEHGEDFRRFIGMCEKVEVE